MQIIDTKMVEYGGLEATVEAESLADAYAAEDILRSQMGRPSAMPAKVKEISNGVFTVRVENGY